MVNFTRVRIQSSRATSRHTSVHFNLRVIAINRHCRATHFSTRHTYHKLQCSRTIVTRACHTLHAKNAVHIQFSEVKRLKPIFAHLIIQFSEVKRQEHEKEHSKLPTRRQLHDIRPAKTRQLRHSRLTRLTTFAIKRNGRLGTFTPQVTNRVAQFGTRIRTQHSTAVQDSFLPRHVDIVVIHSRRRVMLVRILVLFHARYNGNIISHGSTRGRHNTTNRTTSHRSRAQFRARGITHHSFTRRTRTVPRQLSALR